MNKAVKYGALIAGIILCFFPYISHVYGNRQQPVYDPSVIGSIEIPDIDVNLPVYQGSTEEILMKGIGCMVESSPPGGGENTHSILAGHRGLPNAAMFLRLNELKEGDVFFLYISGQKLIYEVCKIQVIRPEETETLQVQEGKDLVSLVTCTPYGINTHRLVVTGERKVCDE